MERVYVKFVNHMKKWTSHVTEDIHSNNQQAENIHFIEIETENIAQHAQMQNQKQI